MSRLTIALVVPMLLFVALLVPLKNGFTDDGYIHVQYANNMLSGGGYAFNAGEVSYGTTSPLWVMLLAATGSLFGGEENLIVYSRVFSWLAGLAAVLLMVSFGRGAGGGQLSAWLCAMTLAAHAWHVRWAALSMEASTAVLSIVVVGIASLDAPHSGRKAWLLGLAMAVAGLVRPEAYLLVPVYTVAFLLVRRRQWSCLFRTLAMYAFLMIPWLVFARSHLGQLLPNTAGAKSGGVTLNPAVVFAKLEPVAEVTGSTEGILLLALLMSIVLLRGRARVLNERCRFLLLWTIALPFAYVVFDIQILSRYLLLTTPFAIVLGYVALEDLLCRTTVNQRLRSAAVTAIALVVVVLNVALYFGVVVGPSRAFSRDLSQNLKLLALHVRDHSADDAVVAAIDIGYVGFYSKRRVLDLGGLVDRQTAELRQRYTYEEAVQQGVYLGLGTFPHVDFLIDRETTPNRFDGRTILGHRFEAIRVERIANLGIRKPGPYYYTLYRIHAPADG